MIFTASLDRLAKGITIGIPFLFSFILFVNTTVFFGDYHFTSVLVILLLFVIYFGCYLFRTTAYQLTADHLIIHRPFKNKIIEISTIAKTEILEKKALKWTIRTFGNGGLFGYYGKFSNFKIGAMTWYATRRNNMVLLRMKNGKKIVITPDEPVGFIDELFKLCQKPTNN